MISDALLVLRYFVLTVMVVGILQVEVRGRTLENHAEDWFYKSGTASQIGQASKGGAAMITESSQKLKLWIQSIFQSGDESTRATR